MFEMFKALFRAITVLFGATEKLAKSADNMCGWLEDTSGAFSDKARLERQHDTTVLLAQFGIEAMPKRVDAPIPATRVKSIKAPVSTAVAA